MPTFVGEPLCNTLYKLMTAGHSKAANKLRQDLKVPEKLFAWVRTRALIERRDWRALEEACQSDKRAAVPAQDVVEMLIDAEAPTEEAAKQVARIPEPGLRAEWYTKLGMEEEAKQAATAAGEKSVGISRRLQALFGGAPHSR